MNSMILGDRCSKRFPRRMVPSWVKRPDRLGKPPAHGFHSGDESGADGTAQSWYKYTKFAFWPFNGIFAFQVMLFQLNSSISRSSCEIWAVH